MEAGFIVCGPALAGGVRGAGRLAMGSQRTRGVRRGCRPKSLAARGDPLLWVFPDHCAIVAVLTARPRPYPTSNSPGSPSGSCTYRNDAGTARDRGFHRRRLPHDRISQPRAIRPEVQIVLSDFERCSVPVERLNRRRPGHIFRRYLVARNQLPWATGQWADGI